MGQSAAFGSLVKGVFDGKIITPEETFYVERAHKYPSLPTSTNASLHSVIYSERDVVDPYHHRRSGHAKGCGIDDEMMEWMSEIQNSAVEDMPELKHPKAKPLVKKSILDDPVSLPLQGFYLDQDDHSYSMYSREANLNYNNNTINTIKKQRGRRAAGRTNTANSRTTCTLSIQTDPLLWKHIAEQVRILLKNSKKHVFEYHNE